MSEPNLTLLEVFTFVYFLATLYSKWHIIISLFGSHWNAQWQTLVRMIFSDIHIDGNPNVF